VKRKVQKQLAIGHTENRNEQFENIKRLKEEYNNVGEPIISITLFYQRRRVIIKKKP